MAFAALVRALALILIALVLVASTNESNVPDARPALVDRTFTSDYIDGMIDELVPLFKDADMGSLFRNCFPNTLDTTVQYHTTSNDTFIITGDIPAMWLRDSANQLMPYIPYCKRDKRLLALSSTCLYCLC